MFNWPLDPCDFPRKNLPPMKLIRTLLAVCALALLAMPATASAQGGPGDNLSDALPLG